MMSFKVARAVRWRYGSLEEDIYPPPTQGIADELIEANDLWERRGVVTQQGSNLKSLESKV